MKNVIEKLRLGTLHFGSLLPIDESFEVLNKAVEIGIQEFDLSPLYGSGKAIEIFGSFLKNVPKSTQIGISISIGLEQVENPLHGFGVRAIPFRSKEVLHFINQLTEIANRNFRLFVNIHAPDTNQSSEELAAELNKIRGNCSDCQFSISNISPSRFLELNKKLLLSGVQIQRIQIQASPFEQRLLRECINIGIDDLIINRPFSRGLLTRDYLGKTLKPKNSRGEISTRLDSYLEGTNGVVLKGIKAKLQDMGIDPNLFSIYWALETKVVGRVVFGVRNVTQLDFILRAKESQESDHFKAIVEFNEWIKKNPMIETVVGSLPITEFER